MIKSRFKNNVKKAKTYPGADIGSDHNPVVIKMCIKLKKTESKSCKEPQIDLSALQQPDIEQKYLVEVKNSYEQLML